MRFSITHYLLKASQAIKPKNIISWLESSVADIFSKTQAAIQTPISANDEQLIACLKLHEGCERFAYTDSLGYVTVSIGRCIDRRKGKGISPEEQIYLLKNDIEDCKFDLERYSWYTMQDDVRKGVLIEMTFNVGISGLLRFVTFIELMQKKDYVNAAKDLLSTKWAKQVGELRANNIAYRIEHGIYPARTS